MEREALTAELTAIFRQIFGDERLRIDETTTATDVAGWDSLSHINLILAVERSFNIRLTTREARGMNNVGDLIELITRKTTRQ